MAPKARKLPRRENAREGEMNLESVSEERIDAITAEPLIPQKYVEVLSPDKTLRLFYNTSTLIRIALDRGGFMQPPHFREPMTATLQRRVEEIEGKKFHFEARDTPLVDHDGDVVGAVGSAVMHRHAYFEQIIDEFFLLNPTEVYVCPICYEHFIQTRYAPAQGRTLRRLRNGEIVVDPLDVLSAMQEDGRTRSDDAVDAVGFQHTGEHVGHSWENTLVHVVFHRAKHWKDHLRLHHGVSDISAGEYRLRDVLCTYHSKYNLLSGERYEEEKQKYGEAKRRMAMTQVRYWHLNARYNCLRYNRVVEDTVTAEEYPEVISESAFPGEDIAPSLNPAAEVEEDEGDFIVDDESDSEDYVAPFSPAEQGFSEEDSDEEESETNCVQRGRKRCRSESSDTPGSSSISSVSSHTCSSSTTSDDDSRYEKEVERQKALARRGLIAPRDCYYERLSAEDRRFFDRSQRASFGPSQLYDPIMHRRTKRHSDSSEAREDEEEDIDFANIGEELPFKQTIRIPKEGPSPASRPPAAPRPSQATLLLDEDDTGNAPPKVTAGTPAKEKEDPLQRQTLLLLDEEE